MAADDDVTMRFGADVTAVLQALASIQQALTAQTKAFQSFAATAKPQLTEVATAGTFAGAQLSKAFDLIVDGVSKAIKALPALVRHSAEAADALRDMSNQTGVSVESLSAFSFVAGQTGTSVQLIARNIQMLGQQLEQGDKSTREAIDRLHLSITDLRGAKPEDAFLSIFEALNKLPNAAERTTIGMQVFGQRFRNISQLAKEDLKGLMAEAQRLGIVTTETAEQADRFNDAIAKIQFSIAGTRDSIANAFIPTVADLLEKIGGLPGPVLLVGQTITDMGGGFARIITTLGSTAKNFDELKDRFSGYLTAIPKLVEQLGLLDKAQRAAALGAQFLASSLAKVFVVPAAILGAIEIYKFLAEAVGLAADAYTRSGDAGENAAFAANNLAIINKALGTSFTNMADAQAEVARRNLQLKQTVPIGEFERWQETIKKINDDLRRLHETTVLIVTGPFSIVRRSISDIVIEMQKSGATVEKIIEVLKKQFQLKDISPELLASFISQITESAQRANDAVIASAVSAEKARIGVVADGVHARLAEAEIEGKETLRKLRAQLDLEVLARKTTAEQAGAQIAAQERQNASQIATIRLAAEKEINERIKELRRERAIAFFTSTGQEVEAIRERYTKEFEEAKKKSDSLEDLERFGADLTIKMNAEITQAVIKGATEQRQTTEAGLIEDQEIRQAAARKVFDINRSLSDQLRTLQGDDLEVRIDGINRERIARVAAATAILSQANVLTAEQRQQAEDTIRLANEIADAQIAAARRGGVETHAQVQNTIGDLKKQLKVLEEAADAPIGAIQRLKEQIKALEQSIKPTFGGAFLSSLRELPNLLVQSFTGGGGAGGAFKALGTVFGQNLLGPQGAVGGALTRMTKNLPKVFGDAIGAIIPGLGALIGPAIQGIVSLFSKPEWKKAAKDAGRDFGVTISDSLAKAIEQTEKTEKVGRVEATLLNLSGIIKEAGGLSITNLDKFTGKLRDVFAAMGRGSLSAQQAAKTLNEVWPQMTAVVEKSGGIITTQMIELIKLNKDYGTSSEEMQKFVDAQFTKLASGLQAAVGALPQQALEGTQDEFDRLSRIALASFNGMIANGKSAVEAITALGGSVDLLRQRQETLGLVAPEAFQALARFRELVEVNRPLVESVGGLNDVMKALANTGSLTQDTLQDLEGQGLKAFERLKTAGFSEQEALAQIAPNLKTLLKLHQERGLAISEETKALIDQATEQGLIAKDQTSVQDTLKEGLGAIIKALKGDLPDAWRTAAESAERSAGRMTSALEDVADAADRVSLGASPGGLKEIPLQLELARQATNAFAGHFGASMSAAAQRAASIRFNMGQFSDTLVSPAALQRSLNILPAGQQSTIPPGQLISGGVHVHLDNLQIQAWDRADLRDAVTDDLMPLIAENLEDSVRSITWRMRKALGLEQG